MARQKRINKKRLMTGIVIVIVTVIAIFVYGYVSHSKGHYFVKLEVDYTTTDAVGSTSQDIYYCSYVGYNWLTTDYGTPYIECRKPDGGRKVPSGKYDNVIPNRAAGSSLTLRFEFWRSAPDNVTVYAFDESFAYDERLYTENATEVLDLGGGKRTYTIENPTPETAYWVKATWGEEYIVYLIPITDLEISTLYDYS